MTAFRQGLKEAGFVEVAIESRSDEGEIDRLPLLVADLLRRQVALIVGNTPAALAAKAATTTVPIVFVSGLDPVRVGLVANLNRPGGNVTGVSFFSAELAAKHLGLLRELRPGAARIAVLSDLPMVLAGLDHDAHVYASAAAQALSKRSIPSVHALHAEGKVGGSRRRSIAVVHPVRSTPNRVAHLAAISVFSQQLTYTCILRARTAPFFRHSAMEAAR